MRVEANHFHPMRGHVEDGCVVVFSDGRELTIKSDWPGWHLVDKDGRQVGEKASGAYDLVSVILAQEAA
jgi:hypothetical protein